MTSPLLSGRVFRVGLALVVLLAVGNLVLWAWAARRAPPVAARTAPARIPASAAGGWAIEDYDIVEAIIRHVSKSGSGLVGRTLFVEAPGHACPADEFLKRFAGSRPEIKFVGVHKLLKKDQHYVDEETGEGTSVLKVTVERRISANELEVAVSLYAAPEGAERYTCRVTRDGPDKPWVVHEPKVKRIS